MEYEDFLIDEQSFNVADAKPLDEDLYCLECAYNLRGLIGDPVRCPECGHVNGVSELQIPAVSINARLRKLESSIALSVAFLVLLANTLLLSLIFPPLIRSVNYWAFVVFVGLLIGCTVLRFRWSCDFNRGWGKALLQYWLVAVGLATLVISPIWLTYLAISYRDDLDISPLVYGTFVFPLMLAVVIAYPAHRRLCATIYPLQRDVALRMLKTEQRRGSVHDFWL